MTLRKINDIRPLHSAGHPKGQPALFHLPRLEVSHGFQRIKTASFCHVQSDADAADLQRQQQVLDRFIQEQGMVPEYAYYDVGSDRLDFSLPVVDGLLRDAAAERFDLVLIEKLFRPPPHDSRRIPRLRIYSVSEQTLHEIGNMEHRPEEFSATPTICNVACYCRQGSLQNEGAAAFQINQQM